MTTTANSHASLASLGLGIVVGLSTLALLSSRRDLSVFASWDRWVRVIVVASLGVTPVLLGLIGWLLERRTFEHFDEWVGRPYRKPLA